MEFFTILTKIITSVAIAKKGAAPYKRLVRRLAVVPDKAMNRSDTAIEWKYAGRLSNNPPNSQRSKGLWGLPSLPKCHAEIIRKADKENTGNNIQMKMIKAEI